MRPTQRMNIDIGYHATSKARLPTILAQGLLPGRELAKRGVDLNWYGLTHRQRWVHLTRTVTQAVAWARATDLLKPVILAVRLAGVAVYDPWTMRGITDPGSPGDVLHDGPVHPQRIVPVPTRMWRKAAKLEDQLHFYLINIDNRLRG